MAERCGGGRCILDRIRWKKKIHGNKFPVKFCLPAVVSRPAGKHAVRKLNLRRRRPPRSIDRGIEIDWTRNRNRSNRRRKMIFAKRSKINGASAENCSGPENRNASISLCKHRETRMIFRSFLSASIDRGIGNRSNRRRKIIFAKRSKINGASAENCSGPENRNASISLYKHRETRMTFRSFLSSSIDRARAKFSLLYQWLGWLAGLGWLGWLTGRDIHIH